MLIIARRRGRAGECMGFSSSCRIARGLAGGKAYGHGPPGNVWWNCWELLGTGEEWLLGTAVCTVLYESTLIGTTMTVMLQAEMDVLEVVYSR
jgi:hypothetical protein